MSEKTVRELGGEIWAELQYEQRDPQSPLTQLDLSQVDFLIDFLMSILARHDGATITMDRDFPVVP